MENVLFGCTGLRVSRVCLGTMTFGTAWNFGADQATSERVLHSFLDAGGNFIDTANKYTDGQSETILGAALSGRRRNVVLATKYSLCTNAEDSNSLGNHRRNLVLSVEDSLKRLRTDFIDLLWVHAWYFESRVEDVARALDDLVSSGKILYWGMSDMPAWVCAGAATHAALRGWAPLSAIQVEYSLIERTAERELLPFARHGSIAVTGSIPLAGGLLTGKHHRGEETPDSLRIERAKARRTERVDRITSTLLRLATSIDVTPSALAVAWILQSQPLIVPIIGARTSAQLQDNLGALSLQLDDSLVSELDEVSRVELGFPHDMLASARMKEVMYGPFKK